MNRRLSTEQARELLRRYRLGQCTASELEIIERWYRSYDKDGVDQIDFTDAAGLDDLKGQMFDTINRKIDLEDHPAVSRNATSSVRKLSFFAGANLRRIAAVLVVGTAIGIFFYRQFRTGDIGQPSSTLAIGRSNPLKVTVASRPTTIYLSDGSVVWLKKGSRLEFPQSFSGDTREITFSGEAYFDVAKDPRKPFVIHAPDFTTRVLGTTFNIKAYGNEESQEVTVITGKVVVSVKEPSTTRVTELVLHPNQKAVYSKKNHSLAEYRADKSAKNIASDKHRLAFDEASLEDIIKVLDAVYDINISVSTESMNHCTITADLRNETLAADLTILSKALNATYAIDGKNIILRGEGCGVQPE